MNDDSVFPSYEDHFFERSAVIIPTINGEGPLRPAGFALSGGPSTAGNCAFNSFVLVYFSLLHLYTTNRA